MKNLEPEGGTCVPSIPALGSSNVHIPPKPHDFFRKYVQKETTFCWWRVQNRGLSWSAICQLKPFRGFAVKIYNEFWAPFCAREQVAEREMFSEKATLAAKIQSSRQVKFREKISWYQTIGQWKGQLPHYVKCTLKSGRLFFSFGIFYLEFLAYYGESASKTAIVGSVLNGMYLSMGEHSLYYLHLI